MPTLGVETFANKNFREWENSRNFCTSWMGLIKSFRKRKLSRIDIFQNFGKNNFHEIAFFNKFWKYKLLSVGSRQ